MDDESLDDLRRLYLETVVTVEVDGLWAPAAEAVPMLVPPVVVITAWNPGSHRRSDEENAADQSRLRAELAARPGVVVRPALGSSPPGAGRWSEPSLALTGIDLPSALDLGRRYGQVAVFELTADEQIVHACDGTWTDRRPFRPPDGRC